MTLPATTVYKYLIRDHNASLLRNHKQISPHLHHQTNPIQSKKMKLISATNALLLGAVLAAANPFSQPEQGPRHVEVTRPVLGNIRLPRTVTSIQPAPHTTEMPMNAMDTDTDTETTTKTKTKSKKKHKTKTKTKTETEETTRTKTRHRTPTTGSSVYVPIPTRRPTHTTL